MSGHFSIMKNFNHELKGWWKKNSLNQLNQVKITLTSFRQGVGLKYFKIKPLNQV